MSNPVPFQVMIEVGKRDIRQAVIKARQTAQLPPYILSMILSEIQAELAAEEKAALINYFVVEKPADEEEKKTADDHTDQ